MSELAVIEGGSRSVSQRPEIDLIAIARQADAALALGAQLIKSGLLPVAIKKPEAALAIIMKGQELGIPPMYALSHISIVNGSPALSAELMSALVHRAGHRLRIVETTEEMCLVNGTRSDDPEHTQPVSFSMTDARRAGVAHKDVWKKYPRAMLRSRAISELCRGMFSDVLAGASFTPEELGANVDAEGRMIEAEPEGIIHAQSPQHEEVNQRIHQLYWRLSDSDRPQMPFEEILDHAEKNELLAGAIVLYLSLPVEHRPSDMSFEEILDKAKEGPRKARAVIERLKVRLEQSQEQPQENIEDAEVVSSSSKLVILEDLAEKLGQSVEEAALEVVGKPFEELTAAEIENLILLLEEEGAEVPADE
jgi:hypothetical protein